MASELPVTLGTEWQLVKAGQFFGRVSLLHGLAYVSVSADPPAFGGGVYLTDHIDMAVPDGLNLYARAYRDTAAVRLDPEMAPASFPSGIFTGLRAMTVQYYDEINKKRGAQWEASRLITIASDSPANNAYSILLTGSKPVDLKARSFGYTGLGVIGRIYEAPTYTGGTNDPWFNMNTEYLGTQPEAQLLVGFTLTATGTKCGADIIAVGPTSQQSRGSVVHEYARNRILPKPNTAYLLEIASTDTASQQVSARLEIYEGILDWPNDQ